MVMVVMTSASSTLYPCLRASLSSEHPRAWGPAPTRPFCRGSRRGREVAQRQSPEEADQGSGLISRSQPHPDLWNQTLRLNKVPTSPHSALRAVALDSVASRALQCARVHGLQERPPDPRPWRQGRRGHHRRHVALIQSIPDSVHQKICAMVTHFS